MKRDTKERVRRLTEAGELPRDIAPLVGVSVTRVYQILKELGIEPARKKSEARAG